LSQLVSLTQRHFLLSHSFRQNLGYSAVSWDIQAPTDPSVPFVSCDVSSEAKVAAALSETVGKLGAAPSVLINNCGLQYMAPVTEFPLEKWNTLLGIMVTGTFLCSKAVIPGACLSARASHAPSLTAHPGMQKQGWGRIVNISSIHGKEASPFKSACVFLFSACLPLSSRSSA
jgi:3-hydroxybutyrate dehydrogenase